MIIEVFGGCIVYVSGIEEYLIGVRTNGCKVIVRHLGADCIPDGEFYLVRDRLVHHTPGMVRRLPAKALAAGCM